MSLLSAWPDFFYQLAQRGRYILVEKKTYHSGRPKPDLITIKEADGRDLLVSHDQGYRSTCLQVPTEVFTYFVSNGVLYQDGPEDGENRSIFRLTPEALHTP